MSINTYQGLGVILTIVMSIWNWRFIRSDTFVIDTERAKDFQIGRFNFKQVVILKHIYWFVLHLLVMFCISTVGGITDAKWITSIYISPFCDDYTKFECFVGILLSIVLYGCPMILTFLVGYLVMGLIKFEFRGSHFIFLLTFLISVFGWCKYINDYNANVEYVTEVTQETQERELVLFYEIPVQEVSGSIQGTSSNVSGKIFTVDMVPYVYLNEAGNGEWDSAPSEDSEIIFITEVEKPKISIVTNISKEIKIDHNTGESSVVDETYWTQYYFYLPRTVIQTFEE